MERASVALEMMTNEAREIRTPNLLIWSQTRYCCAIAPMMLESLRRFNSFFTRAPVECACSQETSNTKALPGRLELPTLRLTASRSNQLSYGSRCLAFQSQTAFNRFRKGSVEPSLQFLHRYAANTLCDVQQIDPGRTRTCNLWFRRPTPYPLGHRARRGISVSCKLRARIAAMAIAEPNARNTCTMKAANIPQ